MVRFFKIALEVIAWLNILIVTILIIGGIGYIVYIKNDNVFGLSAFIVFIVLGISLGLYIAERVRKNIGCSTLLFRVFTSYDVTEWIAKEDGKREEKES